MIRNAYEQTNIDIEKINYAELFNKSLKKEKKKIGNMAVDFSIIRYEIVLKKLTNCW